LGDGCYVIHSIGFIDFFGGEIMSDDDYSDLSVGELMMIYSRRKPDIDMSKPLEEMSIGELMCLKQILERKLAGE
jgi:hypothetical protein